MKTTSLLLLLLSTHLASAQPQKTYYLGHSLVNWTMPKMTHDLAIDAGRSHQFKAQIGIGANLLWQWTNPGSAQGDLYTVELPSGQYNAFVFTEALPLQNHLTWSGTHEYADSLYSLAVQYNPGIQAYLYETWHCTQTGTPAGCDFDDHDDLLWRPRLTADLPLWEGIADAVNAKHPGAQKPLLIVPGGQAMAALVDSIAAGVIPGITDFQQFFEDDIHLTDTGNYFIACVMYATVFKSSPVGLTNVTTNEWGTPFTDIPVALAKKLQETAWDAVCHYPRSGVQCSVSSTGDAPSPIPSPLLVPNPASDRVRIEGVSGAAEYRISDMAGRVLGSGRVAPGDHSFAVQAIPPGMYRVQILYGQQQFSVSLVISP